jgi:succinate dehydrogenase / fumarate reductase membrane anchor subunit
MGNGTNLGRVRALGSAHSGSRHWLAMRLTSIALLVLGFWLLFALIGLPDLTFKTVKAWAAQPLSATALALLLIASFWHSQMGLQELIEDYVHEHANKYACLTLLNLATIAGAAFGLFAIVRLALGAAA